MGKWTEVSFAEVLESDSKVMCTHEILLDALEKRGHDYIKPFDFNVIMYQLGFNFLPHEVRKIIKEAKWHVYK